MCMPRTCIRDATFCFIVYKTIIIYSQFFNCAEVTIQAENKMVILPESNDRLNTFAMLTCYIQPQVSNVRWITPDETSALSIQHNGQYIVNQGNIATISGVMKYGSILLIQDISYRNAGIYVCEVMDENDCSDFPKFATVELVLKSE